MPNQEEDPPGREGAAQAVSGLIFVSDASAEAERLTVALRSRGYPTVDVPLGLLATRVAVQEPALILCDADASGVLDIVEGLGNLTTERPVVFLCDPEGVVSTAAERLQKYSRAIFTRPVEVYALLRKVEALIGAPPEGAVNGSMLPPARAPVLVAAARKPYMVDASHGGQKVDRTPLISSLPPPTNRQAHHEAPNAQSSLLREQPLPRDRSLPYAHMSKELLSLLQEAEQRLEAKPLRELRQQRLSPEAEIDAVLPPEVLASLDEPLEDDDDFELDVGAGTKSGSEPGGTSPGALGDERLAAPPDAQSRATNPGGTLPKARVWVSEPASPTSQLPGTEPPPIPPASFEHATEKSTESDRPEVHSEGAPESGTNAFTNTSQATSGGTPPSDTGAPVPTSRPPHLQARAAHATAAVDELEPRSRTDSSLEVSKAMIPAGFPRPLGDGIARSSFARVVRQRLTGALVFEDAIGVRRVVFRDGDFVTAASGAEEESLVKFLTQRGDLKPDVATTLGRRLPPFGRHAGAALIANGHLKQDELWSVLRAHAEWLIGRLMSMEAGQVDWETDVPDRLRSEPAVFGGSTGAEVFVDTLRRVVPPERALSNLGGRQTKLGHGDHFDLLGECALSPAEVELVRSSPLTVEAAASAGAPQDFTTVCLALVELGVLGQDAPARPLTAAAETTEDPLDDQALRSRVTTRYALACEGDYFLLLGVPRTATDYEVQRAHEALKRDLLPARVLTARNADLREQLETVLEVLEEAREVLGDRIRRDRYRRALEAFPG